MPDYRLLLYAGLDAKPEAEDIGAATDQEALARAELRLLLSVTWTHAVVMLDERVVGKRTRDVQVKLSGVTRH